MNEDEFRRTYDAMREYPCAYEKAILNRRCNCLSARRFNLGEREGLSCTDWVAHKHCRELLDTTRDNARFALKTAQKMDRLPHAKELRVQVGGLEGLQAIVYPEDRHKPVGDIHKLVEHARTMFGDIDKLPYQNIMLGIAAFQGRRKRR